MKLYNISFAEDYDIMVFPMIDEWTDLHEYYKRIPQYPGMHDIGCHCNGEVFSRDAMGQYPYTIEDMVNIVYETGWNGNDLVRLFACFAGAGQYSPAQQLANELGAPVKAPSGLLVVTESGEFYVLKNVPMAIESFDLNDALANEEINIYEQDDLWNVFLPQ